MLQPFNVSNELQRLNLSLEAQECLSWVRRNQSDPASSICIPFVVAAETPWSRGCACVFVMWYGTVLGRTFCCWQQHPTQTFPNIGREESIVGTTTQGPTSHVPQATCEFVHINWHPMWERRRFRADFWELPFHPHHNIVTISSSNYPPSLTAPH